MTRIRIVTKPGGVRAEDLLGNNAPEKFVEIIDGNLIVGEPARKYHNRVGYHVQKLFDEFCAERPELDFGGDNEGFLLRRDPDLLLSPDACLFKRRPDPPDELPWMEFCPEIAVEVWPPSNKSVEIERKIEMYLEHGAEQIWTLDPDEQSIEMIFADGKRRRATAPAKVECECIVEGLILDLEQIFKK